jgi:hypothetical protein
MKHGRKILSTPRPIWSVGLFAAAIGAGIFSGCGAEPPVDKDRSSISGVVTFSGKPLKAGTITFDSKDKAISASTSIRQDGRYRTSQVPLGPNIVTIETESLQYGSPHLYIRIPGRYADLSKSGLSVDVKADENEVNFDLKP